MRSPVNELKKGNLRQQMWEIIRKEQEVAIKHFEKLKGDKSSKSIFLKSLTKAEILEFVRFEGQMKVYKLVKDCGRFAPRVNKYGKFVIQGEINQKMWQIMKIQKVFTVEELSALSGATHSTVQSYLKALNRAGYLKEYEESEKTIFKFIPAMNSGMLAPMIQRTKRVFDPNINKIMGVEEVVDVLD